MASFSSLSTPYTVVRYSLVRNEHQPNSSPQSDPPKLPRREIILKSSGVATLAAIFNFGGKKPSYLGVQKNPPSLALCPATRNCVSTSEEISDYTHYAPPCMVCLCCVFFWPNIRNYNPKDGRGKNQPVKREEAMAELVEVIVATKLDKFIPRIVEKKDDYLRVEYESPILGLVDDVEFWFRPNSDKVEYRSAARVGSTDFDANRKRIKALRLAMEKKGWESESIF